MNWKKRVWEELRKGGVSLLRATLNSISKFKESLLLESRLRPISSPPQQQQGNFGGSFLYYWMKWGPLRPSQWGLKMALWTQNRQWRRRQEAAAPIKSILAKNSLRSQMAEKEEFTHFGQHNFWSLVSKICHRVSKQLRKWQ